LLQCTKYPSKKKKPLQTATLFFVLLGALLPTRALSQEARTITIESSGEIGLKSHQDLVCKPGTWFGQAPDRGVSVGGAGIPYLLQGFPPAPGPVNSFSWWMSEVVSNTTQFDIFLYADNGGAPGALLGSFPNVTVSRVNTGEMFGSSQVMEYTFSLPTPMTFPSGGWFGIRDLPTTQINAYWIMSNSGTYPSYSFNDSGEFVARSLSLSICIDANVPIPLADWAVFAALLLITTVILLRGGRANKMIRSS
jgi:hypothetical protein